jgi:hypothetical protein
MAILSHLVVAIAGTLPADSNNIKKWVEANGGKWSPRVEERVTHLIASKEAWKSVTDPVMKAMQSNIFIVSYDWLEDSLQRKRKLAEKKYTWDVIKRDTKRKRELKKLGIIADGKRFREGCEKIRELMGSGTSKKLPPARKPRPSKTFFFASALNTPFVPAKEALMQRRAAREAIEAAVKAKKDAKAARMATSSGTAQASVEIEDKLSVQAATTTMPTPSPSASSTKSASPSPLKLIANASSIAEPQAKILSLKDLYHIYLDSTGFEYKVTLARSNFALNNITRYQLYMLESHVTPRTYCVLVQYTPPGGTAETANHASGSSTTNIRNPLLNFLKHADAMAKKEQGNLTKHPDAARLTTPSLDPKAKASQLQSLVTPANPSSAAPYKKLICPMNSPFPIAWNTFRHVFRDLTLLSWEERFEADKVIQKSRAKVLEIEPYLYSKPALGMPVGLRVQEAGLYQGSASGTMILGDAEDGYVRNRFDLPGLDEKLGRQGVVGAAIARDEEAERKRVEMERLRMEEKEGKMQVKTKKPNFNRPLFNCVTGRPRTDAHGRYKSETNFGGAVKRVKPFGGREW